MCSRGKDWWVHSPKIPVQSFKWASQTFYLNLQRFKWVMSDSEKKGFFFEDMRWDRRRFLWIQKGNNTTEVQNNTTLAKTWLFSRENEGGERLIVSVCRFCCSSLFHVRPSSLCPPADPSQSLIKFPRTTKLPDPLSLSCIWIHRIKNLQVG